MRITAVEHLVVNADRRNWIFVKVLTSDDGLYGWGEGILEGKTEAVVGAIRDLTPLVVGQDPMRIEHLWQVMYRAPFFKGGIVTMSAISAIDIALHDIVGKALGIPVYQLLGGAVRDRIRFYDHLGGGASAAVYENPTPDTFAQHAAASRAAGFDAVKILPIGVGRGPADAPRRRQAVALTSAVRDAMGDESIVMLDFHGRTSAAAAIRLIDDLAPLDPWFVEEPCQPEDVGSMREVASRVTIPIATGERLVGRWAFRELLQQRACAVIQPDLCHAGGFTEVRKIASLAETFGVDVAPHNPLGPIATAANLHLAAATSNFVIQEVMRADVPWRDEVVDRPLVIDGGFAALPEAPGLGIDVVQSVARRHPARRDTLTVSLDPDGSLVDW